MNLDDRISRRLRRNRGRRLVREYGAISPVSHPSEPVARGGALERFLDALEPAFAGTLPPSTYVWGPKGAGKTALVRATVERLSALSRGQRRGIHTATRAGRPRTPPFAYVDARRAESEFGLLVALLDALVDRSVPTQGVSTDEVRDRLARRADRLDGVVVAVDHVDEPRTPDLASVAETLSGLDGRFVWIGVGRTSPEACSAAPERSVEVGAYSRHAMEDLLADRTSTGLSRDAVSHEQLREIAEWARGDAHDALAAVFGAAIAAERDGHATILPSDLEAGVDAVPDPGVALGRVLALPENWKRVLSALVDLDSDDRSSVRAATEAIAATGGVDLSPATVRRMLYELAEEGILERSSADRSGGRGRPPSRIDPAFPVPVFRELVDGDG